jgi:hypothetical protein
MNMTPVKSSAIAEVGHDPETRLLRLAFRSGRVYEYFDVPPDVYEDLLNAESVGEFVNRVIKPNYEYSEVEPAS